MLTISGEVIRVGDVVIDTRLPYEYKVRRIRYGTAWLRKIRENGELAGFSIRFNDDRHTKKIC